MANASPSPSPLLPPPPLPSRPGNAQAAMGVVPVGSRPERRPLSDDDILYSLDEFLYHGELRDFARAQHSFERISSSLGTDDFDALVPPCLEVLEFSNQFIRNDTLLCLMYISLGCTLCDIHSGEVVAAMRRNAAVLARHDSLPMFARSLDFLLGCDAERMPVEDGMLEREFRLIFNCIYIQLLFNEQDAGFVHSLELGQGRLGASLVSLLFEATKMCADNDRIPIKKVVLLLLRVLQCLLDVPDGVLYPMPNPEPATVGTQPMQSPMNAPRLQEFQAFTALHLHERSMRQKYASFGMPAAIEEGLQIIHRYMDEFIKTYSFHPSEVNFMMATPFLRDAHARYEQLRDQGLVSPTRSAAGSSRAPRLPDAEGTEHWAASAVPTALAALVTTPRAESGDAAGADAGVLQSPYATGSTSSSSSCSISDVEASGTDIGDDGHSESNGMNSPVRSWAGSSCSIASVVDLRGCDDNLGATDYPAQGREGTTPTGGAGDAGDGFGQEPQEIAVRDHSPTAVFQRLYLAIFPRLTETVVLLLRLLLTSCSNVENYPGVIDMARERHATSIADDVVSDRAMMAPCGRAMPAESVEAHRHREIMAAAVSGVILILLKQARRSVAEQFSSLAQLVTDSNGALVVLKFLNQDLSSAMEPRDTPPVLPCLHGKSPPAGTWIPSWPACATLRLVEVLYLLCKDSPERVRKYLIHYKAPFILKRLHRIENQQVQSLVLKLLKKQVRYLPRKWKQANMKAISAIYSLVPMSPLEDWLLNEPWGESSTEGPSQADIRSSNVVYNTALLLHLSPSGPARTGSAAGTSSADPASASAVSEPPPPGSGVDRYEAALNSQSRPPQYVADSGSLIDAGEGTYEEVGEEVLGYARMFPEYLPACCR